LNGAGKIDRTVAQATLTAAYQTSDASKRISE
jgi:hypothetical protein